MKTIKIAALIVGVLLLPNLLAARPEEMNEEDDLVVGFSAGSFTGDRMRIRNDSAGGGFFRDSRGDRLHDGIDVLVSPGQAVYAPYDAIVVREAKPYGGDIYSGLLLRTEIGDFKIFYFAPILRLIGQQITQGTLIGYAQDISLRFAPTAMQPHLHIELEQNGTLIDPSFFLDLL